MVINLLVNVYEMAMCVIILLEHNLWYQLVMLEMLVVTVTQTQTSNQCGNVLLLDSGRKLLQDEIGQTMIKIECIKLEMKHRSTSERPHWVQCVVILIILR